MPGRACRGLTQPPRSPGTGRAAFTRQPPRAGASFSINLGSAEEAEADRRWSLNLSEDEARALLDTLCRQFATLQEMRTNRDGKYGPRTDAQREAEAAEEAQRGSLRLKPPRAVALYALTALLDGCTLEGSAVAAGEPCKVAQYDVPFSDPGADPEGDPDEAAEARLEDDRQSVRDWRERRGGGV